MNLLKMIKVAKIATFFCIKLYKISKNDKNDKWEVCIIVEILRKIDFKYIDKLTLNKCKELDIIPLLEDEKIKIICEEISGDKIDRIKLIYEKEIEVYKISKENFTSLKKFIFIDIQNIEKEIIEKAIRREASDIHFEPQETGVNIRFRIDGILNLKHKISNEVYIKFLSRVKNKSNLDIAEKRKPQDGKMKYKVDEKEINLRISIIKTINGEKLVIRILKDSLINIDYKTLANIEEQKRDLIKIVKKKSGLVIINGPTGSGKSTTLYSILENSKEEGINITTIEDPVEVSIEGITQIQLNREIDLDFKSALKSVLRQDPDIIMVGEIRDSDTAKIAVRASITGHKVYSTLHSVSGKEVFFRLKDLGIDEKVLRQALVGIISQKLIKKLCLNCKEEEKNFLNGNEIKTYKKKGCLKCGYSGYKGRLLISQVYKIGRDLEELDKNELFSNEKMKEVAKKYLERGDISYLDYIDFIDEQEG